MKKYAYIFSGVVAISMMVIFMSHTPVCPDDFGTDDAGSAQYVASVDAWTNSFFDSHPDASMTDWAEARHQYWIDNNCKATLQSYEDVKAGKVDPKKMEMVESILREATE